MISNKLFLFIFTILISGCDSSTESVDTQHSWVQREKWELNQPKMDNINQNSETSHFRHGK